MSVYKEQNNYEVENFIDTNIWRIGYCWWLYSFVIQVNEAGNYLVYIPDESERIKSSQLIPSKVSISDSIWAVQLTDIDICIKAYKKVTASNDVKIYIEADSQAEYKVIKELIDYLQDTGNSNYYLTTIH